MFIQFPQMLKELGCKHPMSRAIVQIVKVLGFFNMLLSKLFKAAAFCITHIEKQKNVSLYNQKLLNTVPT